jgi:hypothetical protein
VGGGAVVRAAWLVLAIAACHRAPVIARSSAEVPACLGAIDPMPSCTVEVGARIVVGPGQSAACDGGTAYAQSAAVNQVFIANDSRKDQVFVEDCTDGEPWP